MAIWIALGVIVAAIGVLLALGIASVLLLLRSYGDDPL